MDERWLPRTLVAQFDLFVKVGALAGALFAVFQYLDGKETARVERSLDYVRPLDAGEIAGASRRISDELMLRSEEITELSSIPMSPEDAREAHKIIVLTMVYDSNGGVGLRKELDMVVGHIGALQVCIEENICDGATARAFLGGYARRLLENFHPYIQERQLIAPEYGVAAMRFGRP